MGFGVPIDSWLRNELYDWASELLDENLIQDDGYFKYQKLIRFGKSIKVGNIIIIINYGTS